MVDVLLRVKIFFIRGYVAYSFVDRQGNLFQDIRWVVTFAMNVEGVSLGFL